MVFGLFVHGVLESEFSKFLRQLLGTTLFVGLLGAMPGLLILAKSRKRPNE